MLLGPEYLLPAPRQPTAMLLDLGTFIHLELDRAVRPTADDWCSAMTTQGPRWEDECLRVVLTSR